VQSCPFCLIGGLALQRWGQPPATAGVDVSLMADFARESENPHLNEAVRLRQKLMRIHLRQLQQELQTAREEVARLQAEPHRARG